MSKTDMLAKYNISEPTFFRHLKLCNTLNFSIDTDFLEKELMLAFQVEKNTKEKLKILDSMQKVWAVKHKVPDEQKDIPDLDLSSLRVEPIGQAQKE